MLFQEKAKMEYRENIRISVKNAETEDREKYPLFFQTKKVENRPYIYEVPSTADACRL